MGKQQLSGGGNFLRYLLLILNLLIFLMGLVLFILAALLKWTDVIEGLNLDVFEVITDIAQLDGVTTVVLIVAGFIMLLSLFGLLGAKTMNRLFLIIYLILIVVLFLAHGIALLVLVFGSGTFENEYKKAFNDTVTNLKYQQDKVKFDIVCDSLALLSETFKCCGGDNGPQDFGSDTIAVQCCSKKANYTVGCGTKTSDAIFKEGSVNFVLIPSGVILGIELFAILSASCIFGKKKY